MLWFERCRMSITGHLFHHIFGHVLVDIAFVLIPLKVDATIEITKAVFNNFVRFLPECIIEVLEIVFSYVLDAEIIYCKIEPPNWVGFMFP